jgi:hypothetical protein
MKIRFAALPSDQKIAVSLHRETKSLGVCDCRSIAIQPARATRSILSLLFFSVLVVRLTTNVGVSQ